MLTERLYPSPRRILQCATLAIVSIGCSDVCSQSPAQNAGQGMPAEGLQQMFDQFAEQSGPLGPMFGKLTNEQIDKLNRIEISVAEENQFGQRVLEAYLQQMKQAKVAVLQQGAEVNYLQQLVSVIQPLMNNAKRYKKMDLRLIDSDSTDAYSVPGGHLLVTRGLLETAMSEAAVVGVLAHELSHLDRGHQLLPLKQSKLSKQPLDFKDRMLWVSMLARPNRPEHESEADADATRWMMKLGYDPRELAKLLSAWDQRQDRTVPWMQFVPNFVKSHPDAGKRSQEVLATATQFSVQFPDATFIGTDNLRNLSPRNGLPEARRRNGSGNRSK